MRPAKVKILGKPYRLKFVTAGPLAEDELGECDSSKQVVYVRDGQPLESEQDTVLHEYVHAIDWEMDIGLKEGQVKKLATGLLAVFKENPRFVSYLRRKK